MVNNKVRSINRPAAAVEPPAPTSVAPVQTPVASPAPVAHPTATASPAHTIPSLTLPETLMLRYTVKVKDQAIAMVSDVVTSFFAARGLNVTDWAISLHDYKTIVPAQKTAAPAAIPPTA